MIPGFSRSEVVIIYPEQWFANPMTIIPKSQLKSATKLLKEAMASPPLLGRSSANKSCKCRPCTIYTMWAPVDDS